MAKWRFVCSLYPEYEFVGIGQFKDGVLEIDDDQKASVIINHDQFGYVFWLQSDDGSLHQSVESYLEAQARLKGNEQASSPAVEEVEAAPKGKRASS